MCCIDSLFSRPCFIRLRRNPRVSLNFLLETCCCGVAVALPPRQCCVHCPPLISFFPTLRLVVPESNFVWAVSPSLPRSCVSCGVRFSTFEFASLFARVRVALGIRHRMSQMKDFPTSGRMNRSARERENENRTTRSRISRDRENQRKKCTVRPVQVGHAMKFAKFARV